MADQDLLYTLAVRLIPRRAGVDDQSSDPQLIAGQFPTLPFPLPIPANAQVIGAVVDGNFVTILVDTPHVPQQAVALYGDELATAGWHTLETGRARGGFDHANHSHGEFCRTPLGPRLTIHAHRYPDRLTQVRLDLDLTPDQACDHPGVRRMPEFGPVPSLPELAPPASAILRTMGGEAGPMGTSAQAELVTPLDLTAVARHYAGQMRAAGCIERNHGQGDILAWSTWEVDHPEHGPCQGLFLALQQINDPTRYFLYERVAWTPSA